MVCPWDLEAIKKKVKVLISLVIEDKALADGLDLTCLDILDFAALILHLNQTLKVNPFSGLDKKLVR